MPKSITPADTDPLFAIALGRFVESVVVLERTVETALVRLLPITDDMGRVLLSGNMMRRNAEIMRALALLPDVPMTNDLRQKITEEFFPEISAINDDRSKILHNPALEPDTPGTYGLVIHKSDAKNSAMMPITADLLNTKANDAETLAWKIMMFIQPLDYDLSKWIKASPQYPIKPYPKAQQTSRQHHPAQKKTSRRK